MSTSHHVLHYFTLVVGLFVTVLLFYIFRFQPTYQISIVLGGAVFYSVWGILHHHLEGRLTEKIVMEYILLSVLAFVLVVFGLLL